MSFNLIDCRFDLSKMVNVNKSVRIKVGHAYRFHLAGFVCLFHGTISTIIISEWLMDQHQVNIVCLQLAQGFLNRRFCLFISCIAYPYFSCDEQFITRNAALYNCVSYAFFVAVSLRRINR